jgi:hypothetical protein
VRYGYLVFLLFLFNFAYAQTENSTTSNCSSKITTEEQTLSGLVNQNRAIVLATNSDNFTSILQTENFSFEHIQYDWTIDEHTCNVTLKNVNVVFQLFTYCCGGNVVFQENPALNMITAITKSGITCGTYCPSGGSLSFPLCSFNQTQDCVVSPLKQFKSGIPSNVIQCSDHLTTVVIKMDNSSPACVKLQTAQKLVERGWGIMIEYIQR